MPSEIVRTNSLAALFESSRNYVARQTSRDLAQLEHQTTLNVARARARACLVADMVQEVNSVTRDAITGHTLLTRWKDTLSQGDPITASELQFFVDVARVGAGTLIADLIEGYGRDLRR